METSKRNEQEKKIAYLESRVDYLETELTRLNERLIECGFDEGIHSLMETIAELEEQVRLEEEE